MIPGRLILGMLLLFARHGLSADEWWAWATTDLWRSAPFTGSVFLGNRFDFEDGAIVHIVSPRLKYGPTSWLDARVGLSLLKIDTPAAHNQHLQGRPELELNPKFNLTQHLRLDGRNRMEWRWNEAEAPTIHHQAALATLRSGCFAIGAWVSQHARKRVRKLSLPRQKRPWMDSIFQHIEARPPPFANPSA
jgi:hypothetical protein